MKNLIIFVFILGIFIALAQCGCTPKTEEASIESSTTAFSMTPAESAKGFVSEEWLIQHMVTTDKVQITYKNEPYGWFPGHTVAHPDKVIYTVDNKPHNRVWLGTKMFVCKNTEGVTMAAAVNATYTITKEHSAKYLFSNKNVDTGKIDIELQTLIEKNVCNYIASGSKESKELLSESITAAARKQFSTMGVTIDFIKVLDIVPSNFSAATVSPDSPFIGLTKILPMFK